ncbi:MAG: glutathione peroxidase [Chitinophagaceae bacterium]
MEQTFNQLSGVTASGTTVDFNDFKGKVVLVVNTATKCGFTPQFDGLQRLYQQYKDQGLVVLGFPCDQFGQQNPEGDDVIESVCKVNHGVTFPLMQKSDVNGTHTHPVFRYLKKELPGFFGGRVQWNFTKFLIDRNGKPFKRYAPYTKSEKIEKDIKHLL